MSENIAEAYLRIEEIMCEKLDDWLKKNDSELKQNGIKYVYEPLKYASDPHKKFVKNYCNETKKILFVGIAPSPHGMCQTGVPFGDVEFVKNWLKIDGVVNKPDNQCPKRQVKGFSYEKSETSGKRLWGLFKDLCKTPDRFFEHAFVYNHCPINFMDENGKHRTPKELAVSKEAKDELKEDLNKAFLKVLNLLQINTVIAIGLETYKNLKQIFKSVLLLNHPSQRGCAATKPPISDWGKYAKEELEKNDLLKYFQDKKLN